ncbi:MAG: ABC transporter ATP-binding protein [Pseudomonadota bacterium]
MKNALVVKNLEKSFGALRAVDNISFAIPKGICFGLLGPNGAGKTTTIEILENIMLPDAGTIEFPLKPPEQNLQSHIGIQFQETALQDHLTVVEALQMFGTLYDNHSNIKKLIELCFLDDFLDRDVKKLSGGQRQRLLLALALIHEPEVVFLDEPTTGLDPQSRRNFWELIKAVKKQGKTIILTTHYMDEAQKLCDDIAIIDKGKIIERGEPQQLLQKHFQNYYIELPISTQASLEAANFEFISEKEGWLRIPSDNLNADLNRMIQNQINLENLYIHYPNLDDLFIKLTGSEFAC